MGGRITNQVRTYFRITEHVLALLIAVACALLSPLASSAALFDIRPGPLGGVELNAPRALIGTTLYVVANDGTTGIELWSSGGSTAALVKDINTVGLHSRPRHLTVVGDQLFFQADDGVSGVELWVSDGTEVGTQRVRDIVAGPGNANPINLVDWNGTLWFTVGTSLWRSDGTLAGTEQIWTGPGSFGIGGLQPVGNTLFFAFNDNALSSVDRHGTELWKSDGTAQGTMLVKDIYPGTTGSDPKHMVAYGGLLVFAANGFDGPTYVNTEPWKSDGTEVGTVLIADINPGAGFSLFSIPAPDFTDAGELYFTASDGVRGAELWKTDGNGAQLVNDINLGAGASSPNLLTAAGTLFFRARGFLVATDETDPRDFGVELWTPSSMVDGNDWPNHGTWSPQYLLPYGGGVLFGARGEIEKEPGNPEAGYDPVGNELWSASSTSARLVADIAPGFTSSNPEPLAVVPGASFFSAETADTGRELFYLDIAPPVVTNVQVAPNPVAENIDVTITATADDTGRGDSPIRSATYRVTGASFPKQGSMEAVDGAFDSVREDLTVTIPGIALETGELEVCVLAEDQAGNRGTFECVDLTVEDDPPDLLVRCTHSPLWPKPGDTVTIQADALDGMDAMGNPYQGDVIGLPPTFPLLRGKTVDTIEIWVGTRDTPDDVQTGTATASFNAGTFELPFFYGCRVIDSANGPDEAAFSGWRMAAVGTPGLTRGVPVIYNRGHKKAVDIMFIPDEDGYTSPNDPNFLTAAAQAIMNGYYGYGVFLRNQHRLNFWLARDMGNADRGAVFDSCDHDVPDGWDDQYANIDAGAILHTDCMRDCAFDRVFSVEAPNSPNVPCPTGGAPERVLLHESGHRPFGLADEYCCDGGYYQNEPVPNVYEEPEDCAADASKLGRTSADCREFTEDLDWWFDSDWSVSDPSSDDLMNDNGRPQGSDSRRLRFLLNACDRGFCGGENRFLQQLRVAPGADHRVTVPQDPLTEPLPVYEAPDQELSLALQVQFNSRTDAVPMTATVASTDAHMHIGNPPLLRVDCLDGNGMVLEQFNAWHPLWVHDEGLDGNESRIIRPSAMGTFIIPFSPDLSQVRLTDIALDQEVAVADVQDVVQAFCDANPDAAACTVPTTTSTLAISTTTTVLATTTSTTLPTEFLAGKKLLLKDNPGKPTKRKLVVLAKDQSLTLGGGNGSADDPVEHGGSLRVRSAAGGFDTFYPLDGGWKYLKKQGANKGYKFKGGSPVKTVLVKPGKLIKIVAKGSGLGHDLTTDPDPVHVTLTVGSRRYCMTFGGAKKFSDGKKYLAKGAPQATSCGP